MDLEKNVFHAKLQRSILFNNCVQVPVLMVGLSFFVFEKFHFQIDEDESDRKVSIFATIGGWL